MVIRNGQGWTPLHIAASKNLPAMVKLLLDHKADINARDYTTGQTALFMAAVRGYCSFLSIQFCFFHSFIPFRSYAFIVKLLLDRDANPAITNTKGKSALDKAASKGHTAVTQLLESRTQRYSRLERYQELKELKFLGVDAHSMDWFLHKIPIVYVVCGLWLVACGFVTHTTNNTGKTCLTY